MTNTVNLRAVDRTEVRFASFLSGGFTTRAVINPPEKKLANRTSVDWSTIQFWKLMVKVTVHKHQIFPS